MSKIEIIMYHYVRSKNYSKYKKLNYLDFKSFKKQLDYLEDNYNVLDPSILTQKKTSIPKKSCILTFDDGYKDHIDFVFPELKKRGIKGIFFPTGITTLENKILDTNLVQHILSVNKNKYLLIKEVESLCIENGLSKIDFYKKYMKYSVNPKKKSTKPTNRYDDQNTIFLKRILQFGLEKSLRKKIVKILFKKYIKIPINKFSKNFYLNKDDINKLLDNEMMIGSHTFNHVWLGYLSKQEQFKEIKQSIEFLNYFKVSTNNWVMCYPFGSYNSNTINVLKKLNCSSAVTTKSKIADLNAKKIFELPRKDTNDYKDLY